MALFLTRNSSLMASRMVSARFSNVFVSKDISSLSVNRFQRHSSTSSKEGIEDIPTLASVKNLPTTYSELSNESLFIMAKLGESLDARRELLTRHIMEIDEVEYGEALKKCAEIEGKAREGLLTAVVPHKLGLAAALVSGVVCIPMVFDLDTALKFNELYVTADVADDKDLETFLEVGGWTWGWMEPVLGTASFVLLTLQFARAQLKNIGIMPFTNAMRVRRGEYLVQLYPRYDRSILISFAKLITFY